MAKSTFCLDILYNIWKNNFIDRPWTSSVYRTFFIDDFVADGAKNIYFKCKRLSCILRSKKLYVHTANM